MNKSLDNDVIVLAITGGPCGGKTTGMNTTAEWLEDRGYRVAIVPEAATLLINGRVSPISTPLLQFQERVLETTLFLEEQFKRGLREIYPPQKKLVLLCDRGIGDQHAYIPEEQDFFDLLNKYGLSIAEAHARYKAVFHMQSAAIGAEEFYTCANNSARLEQNPAEGREKDHATVEAWMGHSHWRLIDNSTGFEQKMKRLFREVCHVLGEPAPTEIERKYLIFGYDGARLPVPHQTVDIEQAYLYSAVPDEMVRIRKRGQHGSYVYYKTVKGRGNGISRPEREWRISPEEYLWSMEFRQPDTTVVVKKRTCFAWQGQYFELDVFEGRHKGLVFLELELTEESQEISLPPFLTVERDVTEDPRYSNWALARGATPRQ